MQEFEFLSDGREKAGNKFLTLDELNLKLTVALVPNVTTANCVSGANLVTRFRAVIRLGLKCAGEMDADESRIKMMSL